MRLNRLFSLLVLLLLLPFLASIVLHAQTAAPAAPSNASVDAPVNLQPDLSRADIWREIRQGGQGQVSIQDPNSATLVQSEGDNWRWVRNGPYKVYSAWVLLGSIGIVALFFALRGRVRVDEGLSGRTIQRFGAVERFAHWLTAICFVVLALSGINLVYGKALLMPLMGQELFASITMIGKLLHNYLAFGFLAGIALMLVLWVWHNIPNHHDLLWLLRLGGLFGGGHPHAKKFNAGQKLIFWAVILGGLSLGLSGLQLMFPFQFHFFGDTFVYLNRWFELGLPADLSAMEEQQLASLWHGFVGMVLTAIIIGHIYIGSLGMEGAFAAMGSGKVDINWAREHHDLWVDKIERERGLSATGD